MTLPVAQSQSAVNVEEDSLRAQLKQQLENKEETIQKLLKANEDKWRALDKAHEDFIESLNKDDEFIIHILTENRELSAHNRELCNQIRELNQKILELTQALTHVQEPRQEEEKEAMTLKALKFLCVFIISGVFMLVLVIIVSSVKNKVDNEEVNFWPV